MAEFVLMPKLGFNMETGQIAKWHKNEGDLVQKGDVIVEILTDKTNMEIESTIAGTLRKILAQEGETVPVIVPIAVVGGAEEDIAAMTREALIQLGKSGQVATEASPAEEVRAIVPPAALDQEAYKNTLKLSPRAAKYIKENKLNLAQIEIQGTGFQGGITAKDLDNYVKQHKITPVAQKIAAAKEIDIATLKGSGVGGKITKEDVQGQIKGSGSPGDSGDNREILCTIDYAGMRKVIGTRLSQSKFTAPHLYFTTSVDVTDLLDFRKTVNQDQPQAVSLTDFITAAVIKALRLHPALNSSLQGEKIIQYADVNIGIAVGMESGLIVPVLRQAQNKKLTEIAKESKNLIEKARQGKLLPQEYQGGTFTISNLGMYGIENFTAIINPPEAGILSVSAVKKTPVVLEDNGQEQIAIRSVMKLTLSVDHRIIDGMVATKFINEIKRLLESPLQIII